MFSRAMTRRMRIGSGTALTLARWLPSPPSTLSRRGRDAHVGRPAGRHRARVPRRRRRHARRRRRSARARALPLRPPRHRPADRRSRRTSRRSRRCARSTTSASSCRSTTSTSRFSRASASGSRRRSCSFPTPRPRRACRTSSRRIASSSRTGSRRPRSWAPEDVPDDARYPVLVKAREGFGSRNIHRAADADELAFFLALHGRAVVRAGGLPRRGVLDRRLLATWTAAA